MSDLWTVILLVLPINVFLSMLFVVVACRQYYTFGSDVWQHLAHNGMWIVSLAILCNIVCIAVIVSDIFGMFSEMFFLFDW
jgi:hypothetical protein